MAAPIRLLMLIAPLALAACTGGEKKEEAPKTDNVAAETPAPAPALSNVAAPAPVADFARYAGHYPFDKVDGHSWHDDPAVAQAVDAAVADKAIRKWVRDGDGPATPIALVDGKVASWACETHNCGPHQWITLIDPKSGTAEICYYDEEVAADKVRWFIAGKEEQRPGQCPQVEG